MGILKKLAKKSEITGLAILLTGCSSLDSHGENGEVILPAADFQSAVPGICQRSKSADGRPALIFPGKNDVEAVIGTVSKLPGKYLRIEAEIETARAKPGTFDVYRVRLDQPGKILQEHLVLPVLSPVKKHRSVLLEPFFEADPALPAKIRIERNNSDPRTSCREAAALLSVRIQPMQKPEDNITVQSADGYNSWPFIHAVGGKLVCVYSRGSAHSCDEPTRGVYAKTSEDGGKTWGGETLISNAPGGGEVTIGKGSDSRGAMLVWVRYVGIGKNWHHDLYRTEDGIRFRRIARLRPDPMPMQITDVFAVPGVGLVSLWFAGTYRNKPENSWGTLVSADDGKTWRQTVVESGLFLGEWPTEPSAVYLGNGRILAIARTESWGKNTLRAQFQLESADSGKTWKRTRTNITDVQASTPSLILDRGRLFLYYYQRGAGLLKCRTADPEQIWNHPLRWSNPEIAALGSKDGFHAGNVNAAVWKDSHCTAFYSGNERNTSVVVKILSVNFPVFADKKQADR